MRNKNKMSFKWKRFSKTYPEFAYFHTDNERARVYKKFNKQNGESMQLTKKEIVRSVYQACPGITQEKAKDLVKNFLGILKVSLEDGEPVLLSNFGKFYLLNKEERRGRNPQTGEDLILDARRVVGFRASGNLKRAVNS